MSEELKRGILEGLRVVALAVVSWLIVEGVDLIFASTSIDPTTKSIWIGLILTVLKSIDKYLHSVGKYQDRADLINGLTGF